MNKKYITFVVATVVTLTLLILVPSNLQSPSIRQSVPVPTPVPSIVYNEEAHKTYCLLLTLCEINDELSRIKRTNKQNFKKKWEEKTKCKSGNGAKVAAADIDSCALILLFTENTESVRLNLVPLSKEGNVVIEKVNNGYKWNSEVLTEQQVLNKLVELNGLPN